jgi:lysozyme
MTIEEVQLTEKQWLNFWKYYDELEWQDEAILLLRQQINKVDPTLLTQTAEWVELYRRKPADTSTPMINRISRTGLRLIQEFEGCHLAAYYCPSGILTIGYGHTGPDVYEDRVIDQRKAEELLNQDLERFEDAVKGMIKVPLTQGEFDALVSFTFNVGEGALQNSTLRHRLNRGDDKNLVFAQELPRWVNGATGPLEGLVRRRNAEIDLALS